MKMQQRSMVQTIVAVVAITCFGAFKCVREYPPMANAIECDKDRTTAETITNRSGVVVYLPKYNKYGISFVKTGNSTVPVTAVLCELNTLNTVGLNVVCSGVLKRFNASENILFEAGGGAELYFMELTKIAME